MDEFEKFRQRVLDDPSIQIRLRDITDRSAFIALTVELGAEHGYIFTPNEVDEALQAGRRSWRERWI